MYGLVVSFVVVLTILFLNAYRFVDGGATVCSWALWQILKLICRLSTAIAYIPILRTLLTPFSQEVFCPCVLLKFRWALGPNRENCHLGFVLGRLPAHCTAPRSG